MAPETGEGAGRGGRGGRSGCGAGGGGGAGAGAGRGSGDGLGIGCSSRRRCARSSMLQPPRVLICEVDHRAHTEKETERAERIQTGHEL